MVKRCAVRNHPADNRIYHAVVGDDRVLHHTINAAAALFGFTEIAAGTL
jgi:hypothetical protein